MWISRLRGGLEPPPDEEFPGGPGDPLLGNLPKRTESRCSHKNLYVDVQSSSSHTSHTAKTAETANNRWINKMRSLHLMEYYSARRNEPSSDRYLL